MSIPIQRVSCAVQRANVLSRPRDLQQCRRALSTTSMRQALKPPKKTPIKTHKAKLEYKYGSTYSADVKS
jgi:hypothetical protein